MELTLSTFLLQQKTVVEQRVPEFWLCGPRCMFFVSVVTTAIFHAANIRQISHELRRVIHKRTFVILV